MVAYTPICQSIIMTGEALANAHKKFLSDYQATVGVGDIDEDKIQAEIDGYQELLRSLDDLIRTAKTYKPDLEQRSMRAYEAMQKRQEKLEKLRTYSALSASFFSEYESSQQELTNGLAQVKNCTAWNASTGTFDISKLNMNWAKDISTRWKNREVAKATQKEEAFNNNLKKLEAYTIYSWPYEDPVTGEVTVNWFIDKDGRRLDNSELQNFLEQHGTELDPSYYHIVDWKKIRDLENDALRRGETYITGQKYEGLSKGSMQLSGYISTGYAFAQDSGLYDLAMIAGLSYAGAKTKVSSPKKASGANVPKLSTLTEAEQLKLANQYKKKSPVNIPENANIKAQSKNGYEQISYKWKENGETIEARWHTRTLGAPEGQGNTFVVEKTIPGTADGQRCSQQILVGEDKWVSKNDWQKAITDRKNGVSTPEQDKMLTDGHWKE